MTMVAASGRLDVRFFGVRGSRPVTGAGHMKYGGNTACVGVLAGDKWILFDAGSGIASASQHVVGCSSVELFLSHLHHDHLMGLMFFQPVYDRPNDVTIYTHGSMLPSIEPYWASPYFPIHLDERLPRVRLRSLGDKGCLVWRGGKWEVNDGPRTGDSSLCLESMYLPPIAHPRDGVMVYKVTYEEKAVVYASDVELAHADVVKQLATFAQGANVLICDAHFTDDEYEAYRGWGHSSLQMAVDLAQRAGVKRLVLFHHAPERDDAAIERLEAEAQRRFSGAIAAREGLRLVC